jgi:hypothetical protein
MFANDHRSYDPKTGQIFVFGSNEAGIHGAGAAAFAYHKLGAKLHQGVGLSGQTYAIPTKDFNIKTLPLVEIAYYIKAFLEFASKNTNKTFFVTKIGCGLAGYKDDDIAPMFEASPSNCLLPIDWARTYVCEHEYATTGRCKKCGFHR